MDLTVKEGYLIKFCMKLIAVISFQATAIQKILLAPGIEPETSGPVTTKNNHTPTAVNASFPDIICSHNSACLTIKFICQ
jgi:hypothetical protein